MIKIAYPIIALICLCLLVSCNQSKGQVEFYVLIAPEKVDRYLSDLASIAQKNDLSADSGRATDDRGNVMHVLEAKGQGIRLWSQNLPLSGKEDPSQCGYYSEPHPDPGQFIISVGARHPFVATKLVTQLATRIEKRLMEFDYDVRATPAVCSAYSRNSE